MDYPYNSSSFPSAAFMTKTPTPSRLIQNAYALKAELEWLSSVIEARFALYFQQDTPHRSIYDISPPDLEKLPSIYADIVRHYRMNVNERLILLLALAPHIYPQLLDRFFTQNAQHKRPFTEFGGIKGTQHGGFLPTVETAAFILAGNDIVGRLKIWALLKEKHFLFKQKILDLHPMTVGEPRFSAGLRINEEYLNYFITGGEYHPPFSAQFPAQRLTTSREWNELILEPQTIDGVERIKDWILHKHTLMKDWGMERKYKPGYRTLFYGPPGTGKSLTAALLGKSTQFDVYRIDLSKVVSKYIGETEKNMANIFDQAENRKWILFFDEADALFGKRTHTSDAKDRYANQEVAYLLQRIEDFPGVIILATNLKHNLDNAFSRRFQSMICFPMPRPNQRLLLWENAFPDCTTLAQGIDLDEIARKYELAGGAIMNVTRYASLCAVKRGNKTILKEDLLEGIRGELRKKGKTA